MQKELMIENDFLQTLKKDQIPLAVFLVNGIKLQGVIEAFDQSVILLKNATTQMVYKHAISTIAPGCAMTKAGCEDSHR